MKSSPGPPGGKGVDFLEKISYIDSKQSVRKTSRLTESMTQIEAASQNRFTPEMESVAAGERVTVESLRQGISRGDTVILKNRKRRNSPPLGVGRGLRTKVNANIGTSTDDHDVSAEIEKAKMAVSCGADAIMDLSTGGDLTAIRKRMLEEIPAALGTVPIYEAAVLAIQREGKLTSMTEGDLFSVLERQAAEGVDFFTIHCGITRQSIERLRTRGRLMNIVSRGGSFLAAWILANGRENPLFERFDRVLEIAREYDVTLSLGDGMRPGSILDATDGAQITELVTLGELARQAREKGVQVMIEGPGHVPLDQIQANVLLEKKLCDNAPFYVLGPLVTDAAPGYDHITSAIGGAIAAAAGADFLCYVTPGEHIKLPDLEEVRQGVIAAKIAGHAADLVKGIPGAIDRDRAISTARRDLDWEAQFDLSLDPDRARSMRAKTRPKEETVCTMCGDFCAIRLVRDSLSPRREDCPLPEAVHGKQHG
jgi:phosphomethylpyrimidine synthase